MAPEKFQIVLVLNEYGDFLSDMACGLAGSLGIGASANLAFDPAARGPRRALRRRPRDGPRHRRQEPGQPHRHLPGTIAACSTSSARSAIGQAVKNATLDLLRQGVRTRDLGGQESTDSFTEAVAAEVAKRLAPHQQASPDSNVPV